MVQMLSAVVMLSTVVAWFVLGANRGWTKNSVLVITVDEVTGIEGRTYEDRFQPGLDFLGGGLLAAGALAGLALFLSKSKHPKNKQTSAL